VKAFDTNALQPGHDFVGRLTRSALVGSILRDVDLLRALFECSELTAQMRQDFAGEME